MTLLELVTNLRTSILEDTGGEGVDWTDSTVQSRLRWTNDELVTFINEAEKEVARRTHCLIEATDTSICEFDIEASTNLYEISPLIIKLRNAKPQNSTTALAEMAFLDLVREDADWRDTTGLPLYMIRDYQKDHLLLYPTPVAADTVQMVVYRLPLEDMLWDARASVEPEIPSDFHYKMLYWAAKLAYEKDELSSLDPNRSAEMEMKFTAAFGPPEDMYSVERKRRVKRGVRYGGI